MLLLKCTDIWDEKILFQLFTVKVGSCVEPKCSSIPSDLPVPACEDDLEASGYLAED